MLLSVCLVVRDAANCIARSLHSVKNLADEIIVVDIGSDDNTMLIAKQCGALVFSYQWDYDFSQVRNFAIKQARGRWILFLEADEELGNDYNQLRNLLEESESDGFYLPIITGKFYMPNLTIRLFQRKEGYCFQGRINEQISNSILQKNRKPNMKILQLPIIEQQNFFLKQDKPRILMKDFFLNFAEFSEDNKENRPYWKASVNYCWEGSTKLALYELEKILKLADNKVKPFYLKNIIIVLFELEQYSRAERMINFGINNYPKDFIFYFWQGYLKYKLKRYGLAVSIFKTLLGRKVDFLKNKGNIYLMLGLTYKKLNLQEEALLYLRKANNIFPENKLVLNNLLDILTDKDEVEILMSFSKEGTNKQSLAFTLSQIYYQRGQFSKALELLKFIDKKNNNILYLQGKLLLHLKDYKKASQILKKVSPCFERYSKVLDLLWLINIMSSVKIEAKSAINQIKLLGDKLSWNIIKLFNQVYFYDQDVYMEFNNLVTKLKFYRKTLYYLDILIEYSDMSTIKVMLRTIESLKIKSVFSDLGNLFYHHQKWEQAYHYLNLSMKNGETIDELIYLVNTCYHLGKYEERLRLIKRISEIDYYYYIANINL